MSSAGRTRVLTVVTLAVVAFSTAAFVRTQALKQEDAPIAGIRFDGRVEPSCDCPREVADLSFTLNPEQSVTATIVDDEGSPVRTLVTDERLGGGRETLRWEGTDEHGGVVPEGEYRLRVELTDPERTVTIPADVEVEVPASGADEPSTRRAAEPSRPRS